MAKTWLITGSSRGIGRALTEAALDRGDWVVATARRPERLADLVRQHGDQVSAVPLDVTDAGAARAAVQAALDGFGALDVVVNNAGYAHSLPIEETTEDDFRAQVETNLFGVVNVTRAALPVLHEPRARGGDHHRRRRPRRPAAPPPARRGRARAGRGCFAGPRRGSQAVGRAEQVRRLPARRLTRSSPAARSATL